MAVKRKQTFDLSTVSAGTPEIISLGGDTPLNLVSVQISQVSASLAGVILKLVQSNNSETWTDITDENGSTITATTAATSDEIFLATDWLEFSQLGVSIDVAGATTGTLEIYYNSRGSL